MDDETTLDLNQYNLLKKIGSGAFSEVYKVEEKSSKTIFAAKILLKSLEQEDNTTIIDLRREINIMSKLNHPSILQFIGFSPTNFLNELKPVIITEFMPNDSLQEIINLERKSISASFWNDTRKLINIYGIASAMSYLHAHNIIHRDLKPANILMDSFLCPKIADFGLSKSLSSSQNSMSLQSTVGFKGTPVYVAPEIWDHFEYTPAGDVYAFGFIVYEIVTTEEPFKNCTIMQIFKNVATGKRPQFNGPVPGAYKKLIERCWNQDPSKRPTFDQIVN